MTRRLLPLLAVATVAVAASPKLAAADTPIGAAADETPISAYGGWTAWSSYDDTTNRFALTLQRDGKVTRPSVATSAVAFDVSVGPGADGAPVALYSRAPAGRNATRDVYRLDLRSGDEQRLSLSSPAFDEHAPTQWRSGIAFARTVKRRSGSTTFSCDVPYLRVGGRSQRLDRGQCASVTGQLLRATTLWQTTLAEPRRTGVPTRSEVRSVTRSRGSRVLIGQGSVEESNLFGGLGADGSFLYSSRFGENPLSGFVRIDRRTGAVREVRAQVELAGGLALDAGRLTYLELPNPFFRGGDCGAANPCRVVRASADPFGAEPRPLAPTVTLKPHPDTQGRAALVRATQPVTLSGTLTRSVVQRGRIVRDEPLTGVPIELRRGDILGAPGAGRFKATGLTATTGAGGAFTVTVPPPVPPFPEFLAETGGPDVGTVSAPLSVVATADIVLSTSASAAPTGGRVTFSGTVEPAQPGRTVKIQRLTHRRCLTDSGQRRCKEDFETIADARLTADGRSFSVSAPLARSGEYTAMLPFARAGEPRADTAYAGDSPATVITVG